MKIFKNIDKGELNVFQQRARQWATLIQFIMICSLFYSKNSFKLWHLLVIVLFFAWNYYDKKKIYPSEVDYPWKKGNITSDLYKKICEIHNELIGNKNVMRKRSGE